MKKGQAGRDESDRSDKTGVTTSAAARLASSVSKTSSFPEISDAEWLMFRDCPKEQIRHCFVYEYAREHEETKKWMEWAAQKQAGEPLSAKEMLVNYPGQRASQYPTSLFYTTTGAFLLACLPNFPCRPWLEVPNEHRKTLCKQFWRNEDRITGEEIFTAHGDPELLIEPLKSLIASKSELTDFSGNPVSSYAMSLDWSQSDKCLIQRFALWLRRNAPPSRNIVEARGSRSPSDLLKQLAALRLSREVTIPAALSYAEKILGEPLYANDQVWSKQRKKAGEFISKEFAL